MGLYPEAFSKEEMVASYEYYNPYTIHDSSNSICHNAIVAAYMGRPDLAYENWLKSIDIDFGQRPRASDGIHFANVGGMWQEVVHGFGGFVNALSTDILTFKPCIPDEIKEISFQIIWKTQKVGVTVTKDTVKVKNFSDEELKFKVYDKSASVKAGEETIVSFCA